MIAFGCPITDPDAYAKYAEPGIRLAAEPDSQVLAHSATGSWFRTANLIRQQAAEREDLEALVLIHQDAEIVDPDLCAKVRAALADPDVAIAGCAGALAVPSIAWWEGSITWSSYTTYFDELGGGELPGLSWRTEDTPSFAHTGEVDSIDGVVIVMAPWAVRELDFDESLGRLHGYDLDICMQARDRGKKVVTSDFRVVHHHSLDLIGDQEGWIAAHIAVAEKWDGKLAGGRGDDWRARALRAEAEADAARLRLRVAEQLINGLAGEYEGVRRSPSWRLTAPLRGLAYWLRRLRNPKGPKPRRRGDSAVDPRA